MPRKVPFVATSLKSLEQQTGVKSVRLGACRNRVGQVEGALRFLWQSFWKQFVADLLYFSYVSLRVQSIS